MKIKINTLSNKTRYIHIQDSNNTNLFKIILNINIGSKYENDNNAGISHFIEHIFFGDTKQFKIVEKILDHYGMKYNATTGLENTQFYIICLEKYALKAINILYSMLYENLFEKYILERERKIVLQEYYNTRDDIEFILEENMFQELFKNSKLSSNIIGNLNSLKKINSNDIIKYINKYYSSDKFILLTYSSKSQNNYLSLIKKLFDNKIYKRNSKELSESYNKKIKIYKELNIKREKIYVLIGFRLPKYSIKNTKYIEYIDSILVDGLFSKLYKKLRYDNNLIYNINSNIQFYKYKGYYGILTSTSNIDNLYKLLKILLNELFINIYNNGFTIDEFKSAQNKINSDKEILLNNYEELLDYILNIYNYTNKLLSIKDIKKNNITLSEINNFYKKVFNKKNICIIHSKIN